MKPPLTRAIAWAASIDAGNASMRAGGRTASSDNDHNVAVDTFDRLWPIERDILCAEYAQKVTTAAKAVP